MRELALSRLRVVDTIQAECEWFLIFFLASGENARRLQWSKDGPETGPARKATNASITKVDGSGPIRLCRFDDKKKGVSSNSMTDSGTRPTIGGTAGNGSELSGRRREENPKTGRLTACRERLQSWLAVLAIAKLCGWASDLHCGYNLPR
jgi:hypothetical protein